MVKIQYAVVVFSASVELLMCALPADNLMHTVISLNICICVVLYVCIYIYIQSIWLSFGILSLIVDYVIFRYYIK